MADLLDFGGVRLLDSNAQPGAGYRARFFVSGTTTPVVVYTDSGLGTPHGTFVTCDAAGIPPAVWSSGGAIKCVIEDSVGAVVQTIDPVIAVAASLSGAENITFTPTVTLPFTNVQDAIEGAAAASAAGFATFGIGITGNATLLANLDATNIGAGVYRFDGATTGTFPSGVTAADTGIVEMWRQSSAEAMMELGHATSDRVWRRRLSGGSWGAWREVITVNQPLARGDLFRRGATANERLTPTTAGQVPVFDGTDTVFGALFAYSNVTGSRAANTDYTNNSGRNRVVTIILSSASNTATSSFVISGVEVANFFNGAGGTTQRSNMTVIVPVGAVYRLNTAGAMSILTWSEGAL